MSHAFFWYEIDNDDRVVAVCEIWDELADSFSKLGPRTRDLIGSNIFDHITGSETREVFKMLFDRARKRGIPLDAPFRCDAPENRRFMRLLIETTAPGKLRVSSALEREEARPYVGLLDADIGRADNLLEICAWCKKVRLDPNGWFEIEAAVERLGLFDKGPLPQLSHGICPDCYTNIVGVKPDNDSSEEGHL